MPKQPNHLAKGLQVMLNDPRTNPFTAEGAKGFKAVLDSTNLPLTETLKYLGKNSKRIPKEKESDRSKARIEKLEEKTEEK